MAEFTMEHGGVEFDVEARYEDCPDSPREMWESLGTFLTWSRGHRSPDKNAWSCYQDWAAETLRSLYSSREIMTAFEEGRIVNHRLVGAGDGVVIERYNGRGWVEVITVEQELYAEYMASAVECDGDLSEELSLLGSGWQLLCEKLYLLRVYMLDHSSISFSTSDFRDPWDSGCVGVIYASKERAAQWFMTDTPDPERVYEVLKSEVAEYSAWANGDVAEIHVSYEGEDIANVGYILDLYPENEREVKAAVLEHCKDKLDAAAAEIAARPHLHGNKLAERLAGHVGHMLACECVGAEADPTSYRIVCRDCFEVLVDAEKGLI